MRNCVALSPTKHALHIRDIMTLHHVRLTVVSLSWSAKGYYRWKVISCSTSVTSPLFDVVIPSERGTFLAMFCLFVPSVYLSLPLSLPLSPSPPSLPLLRLHPGARPLRRPHRLHLPSVGRSLSPSLALLRLHPGARPVRRPHRLHLSAVGRALRSARRLPSLRHDRLPLRHLRRRPRLSRRRRRPQVPPLVPRRAHRLRRAGSDRVGRRPWRRRRETDADGRFEVKRPATAVSTHWVYRVGRPNQGRSQGEGRRGTCPFGRLQKIHNATPWFVLQNGKRCTSCR